MNKLKELFKYRQLISTLVLRELKSRYKGTVFGYFWSLINPLLLLIVYSVVFLMILPSKDVLIEGKSIEGINYSIFLFTGLLPWIWFNASILESSNVLFTHGNLIKKINFPIEVLPIMTVTTNFVHFLLGLPILVLFILLFGNGIGITSWLLFLPIAITVQYIFILGFSFFVSALTVHFRDLKDILNNFLTLWFFGTPIIYAFADPDIQKHGVLNIVLSLNPMTHIVESYHYIFFFGSLPHYKRLTVTLIVGLILLITGYKFFDKLRDTFVEEV